MLYRKILILFLLIHTCVLGFSEIQYYEATLNQGVVTKITPTSYISWGHVDIDFVRLNRIDNNKDGMIKFNIQPTEYVEVSLTRETNLNAHFGFIFKSLNHFTIQLDGVEEDLGNIGYTATDEFRVVKCGILIRFYKNTDLLYEHCLTNTTDALVHTTNVTTASNTELSLTFDNDLMDCSDPFFAPQEQESSVALFNSESTNSSTINTGLSENNSADITAIEEELVFPENRIIVASVFNQDGVPIKQFRIRTTARGAIPASHSVYKYIDDNYRIEFKEDKK